MTDEIPLREWRISEKMTQEELAEELDTTAVSVSRYESGARKTIRAKMIDKILVLSKGRVTPNSLYGVTKERIAELQNQ